MSFFRFCDPLFNRTDNDEPRGELSRTNSLTVTARLGFRQVVDIDLAAFFDSVNHDVLMRLVAQRIKDKRVLQLIGLYLRAGVVVEGVTQPTPLGVPQGGPLSPLLANIVLHELDAYLEGHGRRFARYADDFVICVRSASAAQRVKANVTRFLEKRLKLSIHPQKSRVVSSSDLEFLGFCFRGTKIVWSDKALHRFKHCVRELTGRSWGVSMEHRYRLTQQGLISITAIWTRFHYPTSTA